MKVVSVSLCLLLVASIVPANAQLVPGPDVPQPRDPIEDHWDALPAPDPTACQEAVKVQDTGFGGTITWLGEKDLAYLHPALIPFSTNYQSGPQDDPLGFIVLDNGPREAQWTVAEYGREHGVPISQDPIFRHWRADLLVHAFWEEELTTWEFVDHTWYATPDTGAPYVLEGKGEPARVCDEAITVHDEPPPHPRNDYDAWIPATVAAYLEEGTPAPDLEVKPLGVNVRFASYDDADHHPRTEGDAASAGAPSEVQPHVTAALDDFYWPLPSTTPSGPTTKTTHEPAQSGIHQVAYSGSTGSWSGLGSAPRDDEAVPVTEDTAKNAGSGDSDGPAPLAQESANGNADGRPITVVASAMAALLLATIGAALSPWLLPRKAG